MRPAMYDASEFAAGACFDQISLARWTTAMPRVNAAYEPSRWQDRDQGGSDDSQTCGTCCRS